MYGKLKNIKREIFQMKNKKPLWITLIALDVSITIALLVISIVMLSQTVGKTAAEIRAATGFIGYLQNHTTFYFLLFVLPLFLLLAANIIFLVIYVRKSTKAEPVQMNELTEEQKAELRKQILADLQKQQMAANQSTEPVENPTDKE